MDTGYSLSLISMDLKKRISKVGQSNRKYEVDTTTADGFRLSDVGKMCQGGLRGVLASITARNTNECIFGTDFLRMHGRKIGFVEKVPP